MSMSDATEWPSRINSRSGVARRATVSGQLSRSPRARRFWARKPAPWRTSLSMSRGARCIGREHCALDCARHHFRANGSSPRSAASSVKLACKDRDALSKHSAATRTSAPSAPRGLAAVVAAAPEKGTGAGARSIAARTPANRGPSATRDRTTSNRPMRSEIRPWTASRRIASTNARTPSRVTVVREEKLAKSHRSPRADRPHV